MREIWAYFWVGICSIKQWNEFAMCSTNTQCDLDQTNDYSRPIAHLAACSFLQNFKRLHVHFLSFFKIRINKWAAYMCACSSFCWSSCVYDFLFILCGLEFKFSHWICVIWNKVFSNENQEKSQKNTEVCQLTVCLFAKFFLSG